MRECTFWPLRYRYVAVLDSQKLLIFDACYHTWLMAHASEEQKVKETSMASSLSHFLGVLQSTSSLHKSVVALSSLPFRFALNLACVEAS